MRPLDYEPVVSPQRPRRPRVRLSVLSLVFDAIAFAGMILAHITTTRMTWSMPSSGINDLLLGMAPVIWLGILVGIAGLFQRGESTLAVVGVIIGILENILLPSLFVA